jgi:hypothetical protein
MRLLTLVTIALSIAGCATQSLQVTYTSDPQGALLYENGKQWGYTPVTLTYPGVRGTFLAGQCVTLDPVLVRWSSGAEAKIGGVSACPASGWIQQFTFLRPAEIPGRDLDVAMALQIQQSASAQQQAAAAETSAAIRALAIQSQQTPQRSTVNCTSTVVNKEVHTSCR